ncbi:hypothetical protein [Micromonospora sp. Llam0]|uniref:hypothetical protein n=1 Tax=Micromonospora sp. Llam0 TaxID=2485143 RepID=UPI000F4AF357|nr:hypothetical protein [Micromonospora sp. Llam0]
MQKKNKRAVELRRRRELEKRTSRWTVGLAVSGSVSGLLPTAGVPLLRLLAEESGLRTVLSKALHRTGFSPGYDRGQVVTDLAVGLGLGAVSVTAAAGVLQQAAVACGPVPTAVTAWRVVEELDAAMLDKIATARAVHRRRVWAALAARPEGFPWLQVAGKTWTG